MVVGQSLMYLHPVLKVTQATSALGPGFCGRVSGSFSSSMQSSSDHYLKNNMFLAKQRGKVIAVHVHIKRKGKRIHRPFGLF